MDDRAFWEVFRRALMMIVMVIEKRYDLTPVDRQRRPRFLGSGDVVESAQHGGDT